MARVSEVRIERVRVRVRFAIRVTLALLRSGSSVLGSAQSMTKYDCLRIRFSHRVSFTMSRSRVVVVAQTYDCAHRANDMTKFRVTSWGICDGIVLCA